MYKLNRKKYADFHQVAVVTFPNFLSKFILTLLIVVDFCFFLRIRIPPTHEPIAVVNLNLFSLLKYYTR